MKFSVARRICEPEAVERAGCEEVEELGGRLDDEGSAMVAGRFTRIRSVARGHSIYNLSSWLLMQSLHAMDLSYFTSHSALKVSRSTNARITLSS